MNHSKAFLGLNDTISKAKRYLKSGQTAPEGFTIHEGKRKKTARYYDDEEQGVGNKPKTQLRFKHGANGELTHQTPDSVHGPGTLRITKNEGITHLHHISHEGKETLIHSEKGTGREAEKIIRQKAKETREGRNQPKPESPKEEPKPTEPKKKSATSVHPTLAALKTEFKEHLGRYNWSHIDIPSGGIARRSSIYDAQKRVNNHLDSFSDEKITDLDTSLESATKEMEAEKKNYEPDDRRYKELNKQIDEADYARNYLDQYGYRRRGSRYNPDTDKIFQDAIHTSPSGMRANIQGILRTDSTKKLNEDDWTNIRNDYASFIKENRRRGDQYKNYYEPLDEYARTGRLKNLIRNFSESKPETKEEHGEKVSKVRDRLRGSTQYSVFRHKVDKFLQDRYKDPSEFKNMEKDAVREVVAAYKHLPSNPEINVMNRISMDLKPLLKQAAIELATPPKIPEVEYVKERAKNENVEFPPDFIDKTKDMVQERIKIKIDGDSPVSIDELESYGRRYQKVYSNLVTDTLNNYIDKLLKLREKAKRPVGSGRQGLHNIDDPDKYNVVRIDKKDTDGGFGKFIEDLGGWYSNNQNGYIFPKEHKSKVTEAYERTKFHHTRDNKGLKTNPIGPLKSVPRKRPSTASETNPSYAGWHERDDGRLFLPHQGASFEIRPHEEGADLYYHNKEGENLVASGRQPAKTPEQQREKNIKRLKAETHYLMSEPDEVATQIKNPRHIVKASDQICQYPKNLIKKSSEENYMAYLENL